MKTRLYSLTLVIVMLSAVLVAPFSAGAQTSPFAISLTNAPLASPDGVARTFTGTVTITRFATEGGQIVAVGTAVGDVTNIVTGAVIHINQIFEALVSNLSGTCEILQLDIGPIHLDLLGLVVDLSAIHLTIDAQSGPGNLVGNLLCQIAALLDGPILATTLLTLVGLLNQLIGILG
jgi:hypothetical protein